MYDFISSTIVGSLLYSTMKLTAYYLSLEPVNSSEVTYCNFIDG